MPSFFSKNLALFNTIILLINSIQVHTQTVNIGDEVCVAGYIMDTFCIDRGTLLDNSSLITLSAAGPPGHSVHCLVDLGVCNGSPFEVLKELDDGSYGRAWRVDNNDLLLNHARALGSCSTCDGSGDLVRGYQATVIGTVQELASGEIPPVISVSEVGAFEDFDSLCGGETESTSEVEESESIEEVAEPTNAEDVEVDLPEDESDLSSSSSILEKKSFWLRLVIALSLSANLFFN